MRFLLWLPAILMSINSHAVELKAPSGHYQFKGKTGLVSGFEAVNASCDDVKLYQKDGYQCEASYLKCRQGDAQLRCTRNNKKTDFYNSYLPHIAYHYRDSYLTLASTDKPLELVSDQYDTKAWKVPAAFTFHQGEHSWNQEFFYYLQSPGHADRIGQTTYTSKPFRISGPNEVWVEESLRGESKDSRGRIVSNEITIGVAFEKQD